MKTFAQLGVVPVDEESAKPESPDYYARSYRESEAYKHLLEQMFPFRPKGTRFDISINRFPPVREVVVQYDDGNPEHVEFVCRVEGGLPRCWIKLGNNEAELV